MSDRSDETGPAPETPGSENQAAHGKTAPNPARHHTPPPGPAGDPEATAEPNLDDAIALPADAVTVRPTDGTTAPPSAGTPTSARETSAMTSHDTETSGTEPAAPAANEAAAPTTKGAPDHDTTRFHPATPATELAPPSATPAAQPEPQNPASTADPEPAGAADTAHRTTEQRHAPLQHTIAFDRPGGTPFLTATGLTAHGRQGPIFTDITVNAGLGQLVAICGDGGEGRTSLLLALTGRFPHRTGTLAVDAQTKPGQIRRRFTIAQAGPPIRFEPYATVSACIKETTTVSKGTATRANINAWLDRLAVSIDTGDTFGFLPRIDQIRFAIACAAASRTPAIAVDDADTGLDRCGSALVFEALRTVADAGQLVLAVCRRSDPPADTVVDLRAQPAPDTSTLHASDRNGGHR
ncbi:hypothetical protein [Glycomyces algeriensis]|uniref:ABC transporter family protein n=1 Tax=Glycomyces algeriensis TaxID=256037 RepID=A0A9W6G5F4_9ACTN|nr:hypothetical protein [Glycomyces algeriensis]MDA1366383.1 hypothetical protein [Glycomyces algeriensis]MDR7348732.1 ABC-type dipeptide/oligopeptide/nickel transport system ATPase subunit [Glycomyces algeriensis]GLI41434.1 hypothetical protein GALLR39Z86_12840 [Glycomyces algeriensis]